MMADDYQKVAALLSLDIQTTAMAVANNPDMAGGLMKLLEERRLRVINDAEHRDMRYGAACTVFTVAAHSNLDEGSTD
jgi:hypothetical protein